MEITIYEKYTDGEVEIFDTFFYDQECGAFEDKKRKFSHILWNKLIAQEFGTDYIYASHGKQGEGIYHKDKLFMSSDTMKEGFSEIRIDDCLYFIEK